MESGGEREIGSCMQEAEEERISCFRFCNLMKIIMDGILALLARLLMLNQKLCGSLLFDGHDAWTIW